MTKKINIEVDCAACAAKVEDAMRAVPGVDSVSVSFMTQKMSLEADKSLSPAYPANASRLQERWSPISRWNSELIR